MTKKDYLKKVINMAFEIKKKTEKIKKLGSVGRARQRVGMKSLDKVKGEHYKNYLGDFEKRRYSAELLRFTLDK